MNGPGWQPAACTDDAPVCPLVALSMNGPGWQPAACTDDAPVCPLVALSMRFLPKPAHIPRGAYASRRLTDGIAILNPWLRSSMVRYRGGRRRRPGRLPSRSGGSVIGLAVVSTLASGRQVAAAEARGAATVSYSIVNCSTASSGRPPYKKMR